jgi:hypothetical protein
MKYIMAFFGLFFGCVLVWMAIMLIQTKNIYSVPVGCGLLTWLGGTLNRAYMQVKK